MRMTPEDWEEIDRETGLDKFWDNLEELLREVGKHPSRDGKAKMIIPEKVKILDNIADALKANTSQVSKKFYDFTTDGDVEIRDANGFCYDRARLKRIHDVLQYALNFSAGYYLNGDVSVSVAVRNALAKLN